ETLDEYINNLVKFKEFMQTDNFDAIFKDMENTNHIKDILNGIK
ncbi:MAG: prephenate dehydrogenase, partial [Xanthomarina gelatinilytica]|nr:prephenate dehydrogenase [Xanthomarina gelatinilytica]